jgi:hypothetical protein
VGAVRELVKRIVLQHISERPRRISLRLLWDRGSSLITIESDAEKTIEVQDIVSFTSFAEGVVDAFREVYGELEVVPISFREDLYCNDEVSLLLHPTGSLGVFDIFVEYRS